MKRREFITLLGGATALAARGAGAAAGEATDHRVSRGEYAFWTAGMGRRFRAAIARAWLD